MRFKVDENLPVEVAEILRSVHHDAQTVNEERLSGSPDSELWRISQKEERAIVTLDMDFADIRKYPPEESPGFVVLRVRRQDKEYLLDFIRALIPILEEEQLANHLWIVEEGRVRIR